MIAATEKPDIALIEVSMTKDRYVPLDSLAAIPETPDEDEVRRGLFHRLRAHLEGHPERIEPVAIILVGSANGGVMPSAAACSEIYELQDDVDRALHRGSGDIDDARRRVSRFLARMSQEGAST